MQGDCEGRLVRTACKALASRGSSLVAAVVAVLLCSATQQDRSWRYCTLYSIGAVGCCYAFCVLESRTYPSRSLRDEWSLPQRQLALFGAIWLFSLSSEAAATARIAQLALTSLYWQVFPRSYDQMPVVLLAVVLQVAQSALVCGMHLNSKQHQQHRTFEVAVFILSAIVVGVVTPTASMLCNRPSNPRGGPNPSDGSAALGEAGAPPAPQRSDSDSTYGTSCGCGPAAVCTPRPGHPPDPTHDPGGTDTAGHPRAEHFQPRTSCHHEGRPDPEQGWTRPVRSSSGTPAPPTLAVACQTDDELLLWLLTGGSTAPSAAEDGREDPRISYSGLSKIPRDSWAGAPDSAGEGIGYGGGGGGSSGRSTGVSKYDSFTSVWSRSAAPMWQLMGSLTLDGDEPSRAPEDGGPGFGSSSAQHQYQGGEAAACQQHTHPQQSYQQQQRSGTPSTAVALSPQLLPRQASEAYGSAPPRHSPHPQPDLYQWLPQAHAHPQTVHPGGRPSGKGRPAGAAQEQQEHRGSGASGAKHHGSSSGLPSVSPRRGTATHLAATAPPEYPASPGGSDRGDRGRGSGHEGEAHGGTGAVANRDRAGLGRRVQLRRSRTFHVLSLQRSRVLVELATGGAGPPTDLPPPALDEEGLGELSIAVPSPYSEESEDEIVQRLRALRSLRRSHPELAVSLDRFAALTTSPQQQHGPRDGRRAQQQRPQHTRHLHAGAGLSNRSGSFSGSGGVPMVYLADSRHLGHVGQDPPPLPQQPQGAPSPAGGPVERQNLGTYERHAVAGEGANAPATHVHSPPWPVAPGCGRATVARLPVRRTLSHSTLSPPAGGAPGTLGVETAAAARECTLRPQPSEVRASSPPITIGQQRPPAGPEPSRAVETGPDLSSSGAALWAAPALHPPSPNSVAADVSPQLQLVDPEYLPLGPGAGTSNPHGGEPHHHALARGGGGPKSSGSGALPVPGTLSSQDDLSLSFEHDLVAETGAATPMTMTGRGGGRGESLAQGAATASTAGGGYSRRWSYASNASYHGISDQAVGLELLDGGCSGSGGRSALGSTTASISGGAVKASAGGAVGVGGIPGCQTGAVDLVVSGGSSRQREQKRDTRRASVVQRSRSAGESGFHGSSRGQQQLLSHQELRRASLMQTWQAMVFERHRRRGAAIAICQPDSGTSLASGQLPVPLPGVAAATSPAAVPDGHGGHAAGSTCSFGIADKHLLPSLPAAGSSATASAIVSGAHAWSSSPCRPLAGGRMTTACVDGAGAAAPPLAGTVTGSLGGRPGVRVTGYSSPGGAGCAAVTAAGGAAWLGVPSGGGTPVGDTCADDRTVRLSKSLSERSLQRLTNAHYRRVSRTKSRFALLQQEPFEGLGEGGSAGGSSLASSLARISSGESVSMSLGGRTLENVLEEQEGEGAEGCEGAEGELEPPAEVAAAVAHAEGVGPTELPVPLAGGSSSGTGGGGGARSRLSSSEAGVTGGSRAGAYLGPRRVSSTSGRSGHRRSSSGVAMAAAAAAGWCRSSASGTTGSGIPTAVGTTVGAPDAEAAVAAASESLSASSRGDVGFGSFAGSARSSTAGDGGEAGSVGEAAVWRRVAMRSASELSFMEHRVSSTDPRVSNSASLDDSSPAPQGAERDLCSRERPGMPARWLREADGSAASQEQRAAALVSPSPEGAGRSENAGASGACSTAEFGVRVDVVGGREVPGDATAPGRNGAAGLVQHLAPTASGGAQGESQEDDRGAPGRPPREEVEAGALILARAESGALSTAGGGRNSAAVGGHSGGRSSLDPDRDVVDSDSDQELLEALAAEACVQGAKTMNPLRRLRAGGGAGGAPSKTASFRFAAPIVPVGGPPPPPLPAAAGLAPAAASPAAPLPPNCSGTPTAIAAAASALDSQPANGGGASDAQAAEATLATASGAADGNALSATSLSPRLPQPQPPPAAGQVRGEPAVIVSPKDDIPVPSLAAPVVPELDRERERARGRESLDMGPSGPAPLSVQNLHHHTRHWEAASPAVSDPAALVLQLPSPSPSQSGPMDPLTEAEPGAASAPAAVLLASLVAANSGETQPQLQPQHAAQHRHGSGPGVSQSGPAALGTSGASGGSASQQGGGQSSPPASLPGAAGPIPRALVAARLSLSQTPYGNSEAVATIAAGTAASRALSRQASATTISGVSAGGESSSGPSELLHHQLHLGSGAVDDLAGSASSGLDRVLTGRVSLALSHLAPPSTAGRSVVVRVNSSGGGGIMLSGSGGAGGGLSRAAVAASTIRQPSKLGIGGGAGGGGGVACVELEVEEAVLANRRLQDGRGALLDEINIDKVLGFGSMGMVYHGRLYDTKVVVKLIEHGTGVLGKEKERGRLARVEACVSRLLLHPNIVLTYDACTGSLQPGRLAAKLGRGGGGGMGGSRAGGRQRFMTVMVQEFCELGTLRDAINKRRHGLGGSAPEGLPLLYRVALDIANGMKHLAALRIVHADLKAENVLLQKMDACSDRPYGFLAKVADFGLAMVLPPGEDAVRQGIHGTVSHMPPEAMKDTVFSLATDVFSFGVVLWELYTAESPYRGMAPHEVVEAVCVREERPEWPEGAPPDLVALAHDCWHSDPHQRPSFSEVVDRLRHLLAPTRGPPERCPSMLSGMTEDSDELEAALRQQRRGGAPAATTAAPRRAGIAAAGRLSEAGSEASGLGPKTAAGGVPSSGQGAGGAGAGGMPTMGSSRLGEGAEEAGGVPREAPRDPLGLLLWALCQFPGEAPQRVEGSVEGSEQWVLQVNDMVIRSRQPILSEADPESERHGGEGEDRAGGR